MKFVMSILFAFIAQGAHASYLTCDLDLSHVSGKGGRGLIKEDHSARVYISLVSGYTCEVDYIEPQFKDGSLRKGLLVAEINNEKTKAHVSTQIYNIYQNSEAAIRLDYENGQDRVTCRCIVKPGELPVESE